MNMNKASRQTWNTFEYFYTNFLKVTFVGDRDLNLYQCLVCVGK